MKSVNYPLRKIYHAALTGITYNSVTVRNFYQKAPDDITDNYYIVFGSINNVDVSSKQKPDTTTSIQVVIHSHELKYNDGRAADDIAGQIFALIYPTPTATHDMSADGLQIVDTKLTNDVTQAYNIQGAREYLDRVLVFTHRIYHQ